MAAALLRRSVVPVRIRFAISFKAIYDPLVNFTDE